MSHHPSATSEELSAEGVSAPPTTLHDLVDMDFELRRQNSIGESLMDIDKMSSLDFEAPSPLPPSASKHT